MADWYERRWRPDKGGAPLRELTHARLLLIIRDGVATTWDDLLECLGLERRPADLPSGLTASTLESMLMHRVRDLQRAGLLEFPGEDPSEGNRGVPRGRLQISSRLQATLSSLGLSLAEIANLTPRSMVVHPWFGRPDLPARRVDVFVAMPFTADSKALYEDHIAKVAEALDLKVARADEFWGSSHIVSEIWSAICGSRLVIGDCSGRNPNVFYELGIAHTVGCPVLLLAQDANDVPFDVRHLRVLQYQPRSEMLKFESQLARAMQQAMDQSAVNGRADR
jgi:hypothetical protein